MPRKTKSKAGKLGAAACASYQTNLDHDLTILTTGLRKGACPLPVFVRTVETFGAMHECVRSAGGRYDFENDRTVKRLNDTIDAFNTNCIRKKR